MISPSSEEQDRRAAPHNIYRAAAAKAAIGKFLDNEVMGKTPSDPPALNEEMYDSSKEEGREERQ